MQIEGHDNKSSTRRDFVKLLSLGLCSHALAKCTKQPRKSASVPVSELPLDERSIERSYATALSLGLFAKPLRVFTSNGKPLRVEGNPLHPASGGGAADIYSQGSLVDLYSEKRLQVPRSRRGSISWNELDGELRRAVEEVRKGSGLSILIDLDNFYFLAPILEKIQNLFPQTQVCLADDLVSSESEFLTTPICYYNFEAAKLVVNVGRDVFSAQEHGSLAYARQLSNRRPPKTNPRDAIKFVTFEAKMTQTGAISDERYVLGLREQTLAVCMLAEEFDIPVTLSEADSLQPNTKKKIKTLATALKANQGQSVVLIDPSLGKGCRYIAEQINLKLRNIGKTVHFSFPPRHSVKLSTAQEFRTMVLNDDSACLFILARDPLRLPGFQKMLTSTQKSICSFHFTYFPNATTQKCTFAVPIPHGFESWGIHLGYDGTLLLQQPVLEPLFTSMSPAEGLTFFVSGKTTAPEVLSQSSWRKYFDAEEKLLYRIQSRGYFEIPLRRVPIEHGNLEVKITLPPLHTPQSLVAVISKDATMYDGRFHNNAWLLELPKPISKLTWGNAIELSPKTAQHFHLRDGDMVELSQGTDKLSGAIQIIPGIANWHLFLTTGYENNEADDELVSYNAYLLATYGSVVPQITLLKRTTSHALALSQTEEFGPTEDVARSATLAQYMLNPDFAQRQSDLKPPLSFYSEKKYDQIAWAMAINLNTCVGCGACELACQIENNIPIVGRTQVLKSRLMHWLRIDRYFSGTTDNPEVMFQPLPCMHCENAPCELVCPVQATSHSAEGLNQQIYNRCVGTRYCSNNCPYKVRRFNYLDYTSELETLKTLANAQVTVRTRGVMEKCTYCVQRIETARAAATREKRELRGDDVIPACAVACPSGAIRFGDKNDVHSKVTEWRNSKLHYALLGDLGTRPRTTYLARIRTKSEKNRDE